MAHARPTPLAIVVAELSVYPDCAHDAVAEAYAIVFLMDSDFAQQAGVARAFARSVPTVRQYQKRCAQGYFGVQRISRTMTKNASEHARAIALAPMATGSVVTPTFRFRFSELCSPASGRAASQIRRMYVVGRTSWSVQRAAGGSLK